MKNELFPYLGAAQPHIAQIDLNLPENSHEYRETWEAARFPLIDLDNYETEEPTDDSSESDSDEDDTNQQICLAPINPPPTYTMATTSATQTTTTTTAQPPLVAEWHKNIGEWIDGLTPQDNILAVWEQFLDEFATQFQDSQQAQRAMIELKQLKMKWPNIDQYINDFEKLVRLTGYTLWNQEMMGFFLEGLPRSVVKAILIPPAPDTYAASKEKVIQIMRSKQILNQIFGP